MLLAVGTICGNSIGFEMGFLMKLRLSFSLMSLWEKGDTQGAIDCYFHLDRKGTRQMEDGKKFHQEIADNIKKINANIIILIGEEVFNYFYPDKGLYYFGNKMAKTRLYKCKFTMS